MNERVYLLDVGNTRCKVAQLAANGLTHDLGSLPTHSTVPQWQAFFQSIGALPSRAIGVCVAGGEIQAKLATALALQPQWLDGSCVLPHYLNHYQTPKALGADRYLAAYGAALHAPCAGFVLATFGTATTIDFVHWDAAACVHCFKGGLIIAGFDLMLSSLAQGTAQLPAFPQRSAPVLSPNQTPNTTHNALLQGAQLAQAATVQAFLALHSGNQLFVAGGRAHSISPSISVAHTLLAQPALAGLARAATLIL